MPVKTKPGEGDGNQLLGELCWTGRKPASPPRKRGPSHVAAPVPHIWVPAFARMTASVANRDAPARVRYRRR